MRQKKNKEDYDNGKEKGVKYFLKENNRLIFKMRIK